MPDFSYEDNCDISGNARVCGLDEVGRGPLAGPVVASCVVIPKEKRGLDFVADLNDSKKLSPQKREYLYDKIMEHFPCSIAEISPEEIDEINILQASLKAMKLAHDKVGAIEYALVDGNKAPNLSSNITTIVKGDSKSKSIAAASILAKVHRDRIMLKLARQYPHYGWESNSGYPTKQHREAIIEHGITEHHRKSFAPVRKFIESV